MNEILKSPISLIHISSALVALLTGTWVILMPKGTVRHRRVGYAYTSSMIIVLMTAFGIYRLFGRFGIVHWGAIFDCLALVGGVAAVWFRAHLRNWLLWHYLGMNLSVVGLYTTFVVEATYRLFALRYFWWTTVGTSVVVFAVAGWFIYRHLRRLHLQIPHSSAYPSRQSVKTVVNRRAPVRYPQLAGLKAVAGPHTK